MRERLKGGRASGMRPSDFPKAALRKGTKHELEHTRDRRVAREIAMDHLAEDPRYYDRLEAIEKIAHGNKEVAAALLDVAMGQRKKRARKTKASRKRARRNQPRGWTRTSARSMLKKTGGVRGCIVRMDGRVKDPGAFCAAVADVGEPGWRSGKRRKKRRRKPARGPRSPKDRRAKAARARALSRI